MPINYICGIENNDYCKKAYLIAPVEYSFFFFIIMQWELLINTEGTM